MSIREGQFDRQPRLAAAARAGQREQPGAGHQTSRLWIQYARKALIRVFPHWPDQPGHYTLSIYACDPPVC
jgi:hypothetical protein